MSLTELTLHDENLAVASAALRSLDALAGFCSQTTGALHWTADFRDDGEHRFLNTYNFYRQNADGSGASQLTLTEAIRMMPAGDGGFVEVVIDQAPGHSTIDAIATDAESSSSLDSFCTFLAENAAALHQTLVMPYLAAKAIQLNDGQRGIVRDGGTLKIKLFMNAASQVEEIHLFGIDMNSIGSIDANNIVVDRSRAFDGHQEYVRIRLPGSTGSTGSGESAIAVETLAIPDDIDTSTLGEPEPAEAQLESVSHLEASPSDVDASTTFEESGLVPPFFMISRKVLAQADPIPNRQVLETMGGSVKIVQHPDNANACLRFIVLPSAFKAKKSAAMVLAQSQVIQNGDILLSFRPQWAQTNAYGNIQLGLSHAALALIDPRGGEPMVHTLENPINYSSPLTHHHHYDDLDYIHILRPALTAVQKDNLRIWAYRILTRAKSRIEFSGNYGSPYYSRFTPHKDPISVSRKLAEVVTTGSGTLEAYCSELVWALLGLRDCAPGNYRSGQGLEKPIFDPLTGAEESLLQDPGMVQGPDVVLRQSGLSDDLRRDCLTGQVLVDQVTNPALLVGIMSGGHRTAAASNQPKIEQLKAFHTYGEPAAWYGRAWNDVTDQQTNLNAGVIPNYSPTSFFIMANSDAVNESGEKLMKYVGTVAFGPTS